MKHKAIIQVINSKGNVTSQTTIHSATIERAKEGASIVLQGAHYAKLQRNGYTFNIIAA